MTVVSVEMPLPVTGGTELDDWPGGIKQKYATLKPMLNEIMKYLKFPSKAINEIKYLRDYGEEDAVGLWEFNDFQICCFPTADSIPYLQKLQRWADNSTTLILVNPQFFLNPLSKEESRKFVESISDCYLLSSLAMKGPGALPIRGLLYRKFPSPFQVLLK